jgi:hypothetical protein
VVIPLSTVALAIIKCPQDIAVDKYISKSPFQASMQWQGKINKCYSFAFALFKKKIGKNITLK